MPVPDRSGGQWDTRGVPLVGARVQEPPAAGSDNSRFFCVLPERAHHRRPVRSAPEFAGLVGGRTVHAGIYRLLRFHFISI